MLNLSINLVISHLECHLPNRLLSHPSYRLATRHSSPAYSHLVAQQDNRPVFQVLNLPIGRATCQPEDRHFNRLISHPSYLLATRQLNPACNHLVAR